MISPTHMQAYDKNDYDPYTVRHMTDITLQFAPKEFVDQALDWDDKPCEEREHPLASTVNVSEYYLRKSLRKEVEKLFQGIPDYGEADIETYTEYLTIAFQRISVVDTAQMLTQKFPMLAVHSLEDFDRLGNEDISFPIGMCFGDSDIMGTEGAEDII